jgi:hypothetical protein
MSYEIKSYQPEFVKKQVDLIWEVTDQWKYPYATSYDSLKQTYSSPHFDPSTRFYAFKDDQMIGFVTAAVVRDEEKGDYGTMRFPIVWENEKSIITDLVSKVETRFKELGISRVRVPAGEGMGDTLETASQFGFEEQSKIFIRSNIAIDDLQLSGDVTGVSEYNDNAHEEIVKDIFMTKMGMSEKQGEGFHKWALTNKKRKDELGQGRTSWKITEDIEGLTGFSYMNRSDHNPEHGQFAPVWFRNGIENPKEVVDRIISAHINSLKPHGLKYVNTFLSGNLMQLEPFYRDFGFEFDATFSYEKQL